MANDTGATIFGYRVTETELYGVVEFDEQGKVVALDEKPRQPRIPYAIPGFYFYDNQVL